MQTTKDGVPHASLSVRVAGLAGWLQRQWEKVLDLWSVLKSCRFSLFMVLVGFAFLIVAPQGRDTLREFVEARTFDVGYFTQHAFFVAAVVLWAIYSWYFAAQLLTFRFASSPPAPGRELTEQDRRLRHLCFVVPRWLGTSCFVIIGLAHVIAAAAYRNAQGRHQYYWILLAIGAAYFVAAAVFHWVITRRRDLQQWVFEHAAAPLLANERVRLAPAIGWLRAFLVRWVTAFGLTHPIHLLLGEIGVQRGHADASFACTPVSMFITKRITTSLSFGSDSAISSASAARPTSLMTSSPARNRRPLRFRNSTNRNEPMRLLGRHSRESALLSGIFLRNDEKRLRISVFWVKTLSANSTVEIHNPCTA